MRRGLLISIMKFWFDKLFVLYYLTCKHLRNVFEMSLVKDKGRSKGSKGERHIPHDSRPAYNEFHDEATMCIFRLKSLKEGQARSLLTQAVRHHTAQVND